MYVIVYKYSKSVLITPFIQSCQTTRFVPFVEDQAKMKIFE